MLKLMIVPRTRAGMTRHELQAHLEHVHGPLCMQYPEVGGYFRRYIHHYAIDEALDPLMNHAIAVDRDALTIIGFDDLDAFQASITSEAYRDAISRDEANFSERVGSLFFFVDEHILKEAGPSPVKLFHLRRFAQGVDPAEGSRIWRGRMEEALGLPALGALSGYVHNMVPPGEGRPPAYHAIDEIWLSNGAPDLAAAAILINQAEQGLFEPSAIAAMVTRPKLFIG